MKTTTLLILLSILTMCSCEKTIGALEIRIMNDSEYQFSKVVVNTDAIFNYGDIMSQSTTAYQVHSQAYSYAYVETYILDSLYIIQPADFIGEIPLSPGKYTYVITANSSNEKYGKLEMTLRED